jgi:subtilisin family serine protease
LREVAGRTQPPILADLQAQRDRRTVQGFRPYWLVNAITVVTTRDGVHRLAEHPDVDVIEPDLVVEWIEPRTSESGNGGTSLRSIGISPAIVAIEANRVWTELGIDGTGALVGNLDTGVDGLHPALSARWRGNFAPAEPCWRDGAGFDDVVPVDRVFHGTHVMGTMCGLAPDDTIGVAPGALWIADNSINQGVGEEFDNDVLNALQWFTDPDGDSLTTDDVPDVVQNSWGVNESASGYLDCDSRWWTAIDNCEAAGVALTWSAGNDGPDPGTMRSPADRAEGPLNAFSVGATDATAPFTIWSGSSRGPSGCGGEFATKPEVCAPGVDIYSAEPGGGYQVLSGTSMAGPHVAGIVALMRSANPDIDVPTIKQILIDTAIDLGDAGEEDTYGHGIVNAYEAVLAALGGFGAVEGTVIDSVTTQPIADVVVDVVNDPRETTTNPSGFFQIPLQPGSWTLEYRAFGYETQQRILDVNGGETTDGSAALLLAPHATVSGHVTDTTSTPIDSATVTVLSTPIPPAVSAPDGAYSVFVPDGVTYNVRARRAGYASDFRTIPVNGDSTVDFVLGPLVHENFESADFLDWPWNNLGSTACTIDSANPSEGMFSAKSGSISANQTTGMSLELSLQDPGVLKFFYRLDSEVSGDRLRFFMDGVLRGTWSGDIPWTQATFPVSSGLHEFGWVYSKNGSNDVGEDAAWVDLIEFPDTGMSLEPEVAVQPSSFSPTLQSEETVQEPMMIQNTGTGALTWSASLVDPGVPTRGRGGPDAFGYRWIDSDDFAGPEYEWVEISGIGTQMVMGDNTFAGPFPIGFPFSYYGAQFNDVFVSSNGFLTFNSAAGSYAMNVRIPLGAPPNRLVAGYWDDLNPSAGGLIFRHQDTANGRFIVQWSGVPHAGGGSPQTFQIILSADGSILFQYKTVTETEDSTVGIENLFGNIGLQVVFNEPYLHDELAVRISTEPFMDWLTLETTSGFVSAGAVDDVLVSFDATGLATGVYEAILRLVTNDEDEPIVDLPVTLTVVDVTGASETSSSLEFELGPARPNPFGGRTSVPYAIPEDGVRVQIRVFDVSGRLVKTLADKIDTVGRHTVEWNGRDESNNAVASGVYFYRMNAGTFTQIRKMTLLK